MESPLWISIPVILLALVATREDLRTRTIPNMLTGPALLLGVATHLVFRGPAGALGALGGALLAGALLFPGWLMKFMGAGDVKLMAAIGAWLGSVQASLWAVLVSLVVGGVISVVGAGRKGIFLQTLKNAVLLVPRAAAGAGSSGPPPASSGVYVPKALAVLAGSLFALWRPV